MNLVNIRNELRAWQEEIGFSYAAAEAAGGVAEGCRTWRLCLFRFELGLWQ